MRNHGETSGFCVEPAVACVNHRFSGVNAWPGSYGYSRKQNQFLRLFEREHFVEPPISAVSTRTRPVAPPAAGIPKT